MVRQYNIEDPLMRSVEEINCWLILMGEPLFLPKYIEESGAEEDDGDANTDR